MHLPSPHPVARTFSSSQTLLNPDCTLSSLGTVFLAPGNNCFTFISMNLMSFKILFHNLLSKLICITNIYVSPRITSFKMTLAYLMHNCLTLRNGRHFSLRTRNYLLQSLLPAITNLTYSPQERSSCSFKKTVPLENDFLVTGGKMDFLVYVLSCAWDSKLFTSLH